MTDFEGVQGNDAPNTSPIYVDPMQWYYDLTPDQQEQYRAETLALTRNVMEVCGVPSVASNTNWITQWNPQGLNPAVWNEYKTKTRV